MSYKNATQGEWSRVGGDRYSTGTRTGTGTGDSGRLPLLFYSTKPKTKVSKEKLGEEVARKLAAMPEEGLGSFQHVNPE